MTKKINSRKKGSKAERDLAKQMSEWTNKKFARTPSSGGLQWGSSFAKGDIVCTTEGHYFPFCIEIKFHHDISVNELLVSRKSKAKISEFWEQCTRDAKEAKKIPLLFMRWNGAPKGTWLILIPEIIISPLSNLPFPRKDKTIPAATIQNPQLGKGIYYLVHSDFLFKTNYKKLRKCLKTKKHLLTNW